MSILPLIWWPNKILRQESEPIETVDDELRSLVESMETTLYAYGGAGLSAIQVGVPKQVFIVDPRVNGGTKEDSAVVFVNPTITTIWGTAEETEQEGCLSFPGIFVNVRRPTKVRIQATNQYGTEFDMDADGFLARVVQHEFDHLKGRLIFDHAGKVKKDIIRRKMKKLGKQRRRG